MIGRVEKEHEARYRKLAERLETDGLWKRDKPVRWKCTNCGYVHEGPEAPEKCPACQHPWGYFEEKADNF